MSLKVSHSTQQLEQPPPPMIRRAAVASLDPQISRRSFSKAFPRGMSKKMQG